MTELQAWTIFLVEPIIFGVILIAILLVYDKLFPCQQDNKRRPDTNRQIGMQSDSKLAKKARPFKKSEDMLIDENDENN